MDLQNVQTCKLALESWLVGWKFVVVWNMTNTMAVGVDGKLQNETKMTNTDVEPNQSNPKFDEIKVKQHETSFHSWNNVYM